MLIFFKLVIWIKFKNVGKNLFLVMNDYENKWCISVFYE